MVLMQTLGPFQGFFRAKGRQEGAGEGGLPKAVVGQNSEGQAWAPNFAGWLADVFLKIRWQIDISQ